MHKSSICRSLIASILLISLWLNAQHGYEHIDNEPGSNECEICLVLLKFSDSSLDNYLPLIQHFYVQETLAFSTNHTFTTYQYFTKARAPPYVINPLKNS